MVGFSSSRSNTSIVAIGPVRRTGRFDFLVDPARGVGYGAWSPAFSIAWRDVFMDDGEHGLKDGVVNQNTCWDRNTCRSLTVDTLIDGITYHVAPPVDIIKISSSESLSPSRSCTNPIPPAAPSSLHMHPHPY